MITSQRQQIKYRATRVLLIGASAGGVEAIRLFLSLLSRSFVLPIVIVQHIPSTARLDVSLIYGRNENRKVVEAEDKMKLLRSTVYMAAPDYHLLIEKDLRLSLTQEEPIKFSRPAIDALFESAARSLGPQVAAILMTGASSDGADGLLAVHAEGGITLVQDPNEADSDVMPRSALALFEPDLVSTISGLARFVNTNFVPPAEISI